MDAAKIYGFYFWSSKNNTGTLEWTQPVNRGKNKYDEILGCFSVYKINENKNEREHEKVWQNR